jgi:predicted transcriptional regulator
MKSYDMLIILSISRQKKLEVSAPSLLRHGAIPLEVAAELLSRYERQGMLIRTGLRGNYAIYKITKLGRHFTDQIEKATVKSRKLTRAEMKLTLSALMRQLKARKLKLTLERIPGWHPKGATVKARKPTLDHTILPNIPSKKKLTDLIIEAETVSYDRKCYSKKAMIENALAAGSISKVTAAKMMRCRSQAVYEMLSGEPG